MADKRTPQDRANPNTDMLRAEIDAGRTRDKVAVSDPAAAPLGTDDEAAGMSPRPAEVAEAMHYETSTPTEEPDRSFLQRTWPWILAVLVVIAIFAVLLAI